MPAARVPEAATSTTSNLLGRTLAADVLHRMRSDIVSAAFLPGHRLRFETMRERYGVSFSTLREALAHLVREGLVVAEGQRGFAVAPVSRDELLDLMEVRVLIEQEALRRSLERGDEAWMAAMTAAFEALEAARAVAGGRPASASAAWNDRHQDFHHALISACGSPNLLNIRALLWQRMERYRTLVRKLCPDACITPEHHAHIHAAARARDIPRVTDLVVLSLIHI